MLTELGSVAQSVLALSHGLALEDSAKNTFPLNHAPLDFVWKTNSELEAG